MCVPQMPTSLQLFKFPNGVDVWEGPVGKMRRGGCVLDPLQLIFMAQKSAEHYADVRAGVGILKVIGNKREGKNIAKTSHHPLGPIYAYFPMMEHSIQTTFGS